MQPSLTLASVHNIKTSAAIDHRTRISRPYGCVTAAAINEHVVVLRDNKIFAGARVKAQLETIKTAGEKKFIISAVAIGLKLVQVASGVSTIVHFAVAIRQGGSTVF